MRLRLTAIIYFGCTSFLFGQSKWEMVGEYKHSVFMYSYKLTLTDSENYEVEESSDLGSERTIGTWKMAGRAIWLTPRKKITIDIHKKQEEREMTNSDAEVVEVVTKDVLALKAKDFQLTRTK
jgi:hypothetical protein